MRNKVIFAAILAAMAALNAAGQTFGQEVRFLNGKRYAWIAGSFNKVEANRAAALIGGYPIVFNTMTEHSVVTTGFGYRRIAPCHTGHYQLANGAEPQMGWVTANGSRSADITKLFNSNGPDDGVRKKWGWSIGDGGVAVWYGDSDGKNEDAAVIWHDNNGLLEDVSINHRGGVLVEFDR